jgi:hypothetical protein
MLNLKLVYIDAYLADEEEDARLICTLIDDLEGAIRNMAQELEGDR